MNLNEQILLEMRLELEEIISEREGMIAENMQRQSIDQSIAYHYDSFYENALRLRAIRERLISLGEK